MVGNEFDELIRLLSYERGWVPGFIVWVGAVRLPLKLMSGWVLSGLTRAVEGVRGTSDAEWVDRILRARWYRVLAFLADWLLSVKLPKGVEGEER